MKTVTNDVINQDKSRLLGGLKVSYGGLPERGDF